MTDRHPEPDLTAEREREPDAALGGIEARAVLLDVDTDDDILDDDPALAPATDGADDDEVVEDPDAGPLDADV
jgi:hypothetical protein